MSPENASVERALEHVYNDETRSDAIRALHAWMEWCQIDSLYPRFEEVWRFSGNYPSCFYEQDNDVTHTANMCSLFKYLSDQVPLSQEIVYKTTYQIYAHDLHEIYDGDHAAHNGHPQTNIRPIITAQRFPERVRNIIITFETTRNFIKGGKLKPEASIQDVNAAAIVMALDFVEGMTTYYRLLHSGFHHNRITNNELLQQLAKNAEILPARLQPLYNIERVLSNNDFLMSGTMNFIRVALQFGFNAREIYISSMCGKCPDALDYKTYKG